MAMIGSATSIAGALLTATALLTIIAAAPIRSPARPSSGDEGAGFSCFCAST
jgi:hypothetical protein